MKLDTAIDGYWLARKREFSSNTVRDYDLTFRRLIHYIGKDKLIEEITSTHINRYLNFLQTQCRLGPKSLSNVWTALSSLWTWAEIELNIPHVIRGTVNRPKFRRPQILAYTETEIRALIAACDYAAGWNGKAGKRARASRPTAPRDKAIMICLLDTGLRISELCALTLRDYERESGRLTVRRGKGGKKRTVYLGETAQRHVWKYLATRTESKLDAPLFSARNGSPLDRHGTRHMIERAGQRSGIANAGAHRFRHTFAVNFLRNGGNLLELKELLGHETIDTLRIYVDLAQTDIETAHKRSSPADNWRL